MLQTLQVTNQNAKFTLLSALVVLLSPSLALAEAKTAGADTALAVSGGIAAPGGPTAVFQNAAGLTQNVGFGALVQAGAGDSLSNPFIRAGLLGGGSSYGLVGGITQSTTSPSSTSAFYGLAVAPGAGFSIGVAGQTGISNAGGTGINAGILFSGTSPVSVGVTAIGLTDAVDEWGVGISTLAGPVLLVLDGAYNPGAKKFGLKPGIRAGSATAAITLSYGFVDAASTSQLADGFTVGAGLKLGSGNLQLYYNDLAKFYAGVTFML